MKHEFIQSSGNVFADLGFDDEQADYLEFRSLLMTLLSKYIEHKKLTQKQAAIELGVTQPRISNLIHGKIDLFSNGMLIEMLERAGFKVYEKIAIDAKVFLNQYNMQSYNI